MLLKMFVAFKTVSFYCDYYIVWFYWGAKSQREFYFQQKCKILFQRLFISSETAEHPQKSRIVQSDWYKRQNFVWTQFSKYHRHGNNEPMLGKMFGGL